MSASKSYIIVGGGPSGISLALLLAQNGREVMLIEKGTMLGGFWKCTLKGRDPWQEPCPRAFILRGSLKRMFRWLGLLDDEFVERMYPSSLTAIRRFLKLSATDLVKIAKAVVYYSRWKPDLMDEWLARNKLSPTGHALIYQMYVLTGTAPEKMNASDLFHFLYTAAFPSGNAYGMKDPSTNVVGMMHILERSGPRTDSLSCLHSNMLRGTKSSIAFTCECIFTG